MNLIESENLRRRNTAGAPEEKVMSLLIKSAIWSLQINIIERDEFGLLFSGYLLGSNLELNNLIGDYTWQLRECEDLQLFSQNKRGLAWGKIIVTKWGYAPNWG